MPKVRRGCETCSRWRRCRTVWRGNRSSSMFGPFRQTWPPSQVRDTNTRRGCCRPVTMAAVLLDHQPVSAQSQQTEPRPSAAPFGIPGLIPTCLALNVHTELSQIGGKVTGRRTDDITLCCHGYSGAADSSINPRFTSHFYFYPLVRKTDLGIKQNMFL